MRVDMLQQLMNGQPRTRPAPTAEDAFTRPGTAPAPVRSTAPLSPFSSVAVSAADAVAIAAELARAQDQVRQLQRENVQLRAALGQAMAARGGSAGQGSPAGFAGAGAPAQRRAPPRAAAVTVDVTGGSARTSPAPQQRTAPGPQPGSVEVDTAEEAPPAPSPQDVAWFGDHLKGSEPADFSSYEDLEADLGLV